MWRGAFDVVEEGASWCSQRRAIGRATLARENEAGAVGGRGSIYSMLKGN